MAQNLVTFHYTLRDSSDRMIDMSIGGEPVSYLEGAGQIIDGLEEQLRGMPAGAKSTVTVPAAKAYGARDESLMHRVKRELLPIDGEVSVGDQFRTEPSPMAPIVTVAAIEGDEIILDANHPLAGVDLTFHVEIVSTREATPEEIEQMTRRRGCCGGKKGDCEGNCSDDCDCGDGNGEDCDCKN